MERWKYLILTSSVHMRSDKPADGKPDINGNLHNISVWVGHVLRLKAIVWPMPIEGHQLAVSTFAVIVDAARLEISQRFLTRRRSRNLRGALPNL